MYRLSMVVLVCLANAVLNSAAASETAPRPNILILFVDNVGYGDLGCYGNADNKTPHIDRLAEQGVLCTDFYTAAPSCTPSRGAILTGRHPQRNGLNYQLNAAENAAGIGLPHSEKLLPAYLKPHGYATAAFGKWNIGFAEGSRPTDRGFDEFFGHRSGNIHYYKHVYNGENDLRHGTQPVERPGEYATDIFADAACDYIRRHQQQSWLVYLPFNAPHFIGNNNVQPGESMAWQVPDKYLALYGANPDTDDQQVRFRAVLTALDDAIGRVVQTVDECGLAERTIVCFISDNGAFMLPGRGLEVQSNHPLRDGGITTYEGGTRVPAIVRWTGVLPSGAVCREMLSTLDMVPMSLAVAGAALPDDRVIDGRNPLPALRGEAATPHGALHWVWRQGSRQLWQALRQGNDKIVRATPDAAWELYDLAADVGEQQNLAAAMPERVAALAAEFDRRENEIADDPTRSRSARE